MEILLETDDQYRPSRFSVIECDTPEEAEEKLNDWIAKKTKLLQDAKNVERIALVME